MIKLNSFVLVDGLGGAWIEACPAHSPHWRVRLAHTEQSMLVPRGDIAEPGEDTRLALLEQGRLHWHDSAMGGLSDGHGNFSSGCRRFAT